MAKTKLKCEAALTDATKYLEVIADFEKRFKVVRRIESACMQMMQNPMYGKGGMHVPGQPQQIPAVFIAIVFIVEVPDVPESNIKISKP